MAELVAEMSETEKLTGTVKWFDRKKVRDHRPY